MVGTTDLEMKLDLGKLSQITPLAEYEPDVHVSLFLAIELYESDQSLILVKQSFLELNRKINFNDAVEHYSGTLVTNTKRQQNGFLHVDLLLNHDKLHKTLSTS